MAILDVFGSTVVQAAVGAEVELGILRLPAAEALVDTGHGVHATIKLRTRATEIIADRVSGNAVSFPCSTAAVNANPEIRTMIGVSEAESFAFTMGNQEVAWDIARLSGSLNRSYQQVKWGRGIYNLDGGQCGKILTAE